MLRIHYLQQWFRLSDPAMEEALHDVPLCFEFAKLRGATARLPDETTILRFRHPAGGQRHPAGQGLDDAHRHGGGRDADLGAELDQNANGARDPEMKPTRKGNNWYFGMKAHIGVDAQPGLVHTVAGTAANVNDLNMAGALLHGAEEAAFGDAGYQGVHKRPEATGPTWHVAMRPGKRRKLNPSIEPDFVVERAEKMKASA
jgi:transposase, IS5 family